VRISFPGEGVEVIKTGQVAAGAFQSFVLEALQGQELMASLDSPNHDLVLGIYGSTDGTWLVTPSQSLSTFQAPIPESGEYVVEAAAATAGDSFTLSITLATTIVLQPGSALTITGTALEVPVVTHLLPIRAGQNLTLDLKSKSATTFLVLYGFQDGKFLLTLDRRATQFNGHLPASEDYVVQVVQGAMPSDFTLTMKIG
jgi:hypothetical protein